MSNIDELIEQLRRKGLSRASALGYHSGLFDAAADALEKLQAELEQAKVERDAAVSDLEAVMAYGGGNLDTCQFCKKRTVLCKRRGKTMPTTVAQPEGELTMERMTEHRGKRTIIVDIEKHHESTIRRLALIEDILGDTYDLGRLLELVEMDKQGRALIVTDEMATAMRAGALVLRRKVEKKLIGSGLNWMLREGKTLYIPYRKAADMLKEAAEAALAKEDCK